MSEQNEKVFRGVWVPAEIWETHTLSWMEKCLWAEISSLGTEEKPCFASNAYLAAKFNSTESSMISKLKSLKMVKQVSYDGRSRKMVAILPKETSPTSEVRVHPQVKSDSTHGCNIDTSVDAKLGSSPIVPLEGDAELNPIVDPDATQGAIAHPTKSDDLCSRPPRSMKTVKLRSTRKSPPPKPDDVTEETWQAWCEMRKTKQASISTPVINLLRNEANKAGWSLNSAMQECVLRNWQGFKAAWLEKAYQQEKQSQGI